MVEYGNISINKNNNFLGSKFKLKTSYMDDIWQEYL